MAPPISNTAEGGSNGVTVSTANSGGTSGTAWDSVSVGTGLTYDTATKMHGGVGYAFAAPANVIESLQWTTSLGSQTDIYWRMYMFRSATPLEQQRIVRFFNTAGGTEGGRISWHTDGKLYSFDSTLAVPGASSFTLTANQWLRFEGRILASATVGIIEVKAYVGDNTSAIGTYTRTNVNTLTTIGEIRFGNAVAATPGAFWMDDFTVVTTGYPGPATSSQTLLPDADLAAGGWTTSPLFSKVNDSSDATIITATAS